MKRFGIDISTWQSGFPYYRAQQEGVEFAILRAGYSTAKDAAFDTHYASLKAIGVPVGAYWYMYATTPAEALAEARACLSVISGTQLEYPVYLDLEDPSLKGLGRDTLDSLVRTFCDEIERNGYYVGVYTNIDWYNNYISGHELNQKYDWWIASWGTQEPSGLDYGMWQFGGSTNFLRSTQVAGVTTDQNYCYKDYPNIMIDLGLNGFSQGAPAVLPTTEPVITPPTTSSDLFAVGDKVQVVQAVQYNGEPFVAYFSTYDVIEVNGDRIVIGKGAAVTAAVRASSIIKVGAVSTGTIEVGDKVKVLNAIQYNGQPFTAYYDTYDVIEVSGNRVVIGKGSIVTAAVNKANLVAI